MDKIFKNNTIMGIVAIVTLALTVMVFLKTRSDNKTITNPAPTMEE